jgi:hypothetical protein
MGSFTQREDGRKTSVLSLLETLPWLFERPPVYHNLSCTVLDLPLAWDSRGKDSQRS